MPLSVLVLYDPKGHAIEALAGAAAEGIESKGLARAKVKRVDEALRGDLLDSDAIMLGSPNWSGITGSMKLWLDDQGDLWEEGSLAGRPGAAFTTGGGRHSGLEMTLLQLVHWMLACGMVVVGLPWSERMRLSGSYYGATAAGGASEDDLAQARELGARLARVADRLISTKVRSYGSLGAFKGPPLGIVPEMQVAEQSRMNIHGQLHGLQHRTPYSEVSQL